MNNEEQSKDKEYNKKHNKIVEFVSGKNLQNIKKQSSQIKPQFNIGKQIITTSFIQSINDYLKAHGLVKIKVLVTTDKSEIKKIALEVAKKTESQIIETKGFTFSLYKEFEE